MFENLLAAFYLSGGGSFEQSKPDQLLDGYKSMRTEPRYSLGAGLSFDAAKHIEVDFGYRFENGLDMTVDRRDWSQRVYMEIRVRPWVR